MPKRKINKIIKFYEQTGVSIIWIDDIPIAFNGDIRDFIEHFPHCEIIETEGAGIWDIKLE